MTPAAARRACRVAVVGAGVAGLASARALLSQGHEAVVFEKSSRVGGTWVYDPRVESDPLGRNPERNIVHGSIYQSLRTNLPRQLMGFLDFPFPEPSRCYGDPRAFPSHREVLAFLEDYARESRVEEVVRFGEEVVRVAQDPCGQDSGWVVESKRSGSCSISCEAETTVQKFDAVVVCNGHHTHPRIAEIPGIHKWSGKQIHSHNYRIPVSFIDKIVVLIGNATSAHDISREVSTRAKEVHLASRSKDIISGKLEGHSNIWQHQMIQYVSEDGKVVFMGGTSVYPDVIIHCTGYLYYFPFLECNGIVSVDDNRVGPLYKHVFPPRLAPWLSFVGIPNKLIPFTAIELQAKWIARVLSGKTALPTEEEMMASVLELYHNMESEGTPKHHTHSIYPKQVDYLNWLAAEAGLPALEDWRTDMYRAAFECICSHNDMYRETWDVDYWFARLNTPR